MRLDREVVVRVGLGAALAVVVAAGFHHAFTLSDLATAVLPPLALGVLAATCLCHPAVPRWARPVGVVVGVPAAAAIALRAVPRPAAVVDGLATFLTVVLPAPGLAGPRVAPALVLVPVTTAVVTAAVRGHVGRAIAAAWAGLLAVGLLAGEARPGSVVVVALLVVSGVHLAAHARADLADIAPLIGVRTEQRRATTWWRPLPSAVAVVAASIAVTAVVPRAEPWDASSLVAEDDVTVSDDNPLATAVAWLAVTPAEPAYRQRVDGPDPGRVRLAVLDQYDGTGWRQGARFRVTGASLQPDPVTGDDTLPAASSDGGDGGTDAIARPGDTANVAIEVLDVGRDFSTLPVAGRPVELSDPEGVRFAPVSGELLAEGTPDGVAYRAQVMAVAAPTARDTSAPDAPGALLDCPASEVIRTIAQQVTSGIVDPVERLAALANWIKVQRIYDPAGPGGQTMRAVESFLSGPRLTNGNLEVYVTSFALLARCAGVPARVVVGLPAAGDGVADRTYTTADVTAWVETPLTDSGWVPVDPLPTPSEQLQQAQLAGLDEPTPPAPTDEPAPDPPSTVVATPLADPGGGLRSALLIGLAVAVLALVATWTFVVPAWIVRRRRRAADPDAAGRGAWATVVDACEDRGSTVPADQTPTDVARAVATRWPTCGRLVGHLAPRMDRLAYSGRETPPHEAGEMWAVASEAVRRMPTSWSSRLAPLRHPGRTWRRALVARRIAVGRQRWTAAIPDGLVLSTGQAPDDVPEIAIDSVVGQGSTGVVYRATHLPSGRAVAVKVFTYGPAHLGFDQQRFEWEVQIARRVSGRPNLPEVLGAGITPRTEMPYLVTSLYERGTLLERVRRGGVLSPSEALALGVDLATAVHSLHEMGVVHADVKPENVFSSDSSWILGDLGSAWLRASRGPAASLTPPYAAPEVWRGGSPTPQADLYSVALTMLFAVTGQVPIAGNPPPHDDIVAAFPDAPVLMRTLDPDARRRPKTAAEFARALDPFAARQVVDAVGSPLPTPTVTVSRRR